MQPDRVLYPARALDKARSSAVKHYLDMVGVTGSSLVAPTGFTQTPQIFGSAPFWFVRSSNVLDVPKHLVGRQFGPGTLSPVFKENTYKIDANLSIR